MITDAKKLRAYKKKYNFFETPAPIALEMADLLGLGRNARVLEPSAGLGMLTDLVAEQYITPRIDFCEIQPEFITQLEDKYSHVAGDFEAYNPGPIYDAVIMNPPYKNKMAERHVSHAWDCLKPGGRIVALVSTGAALEIDEEFYGHVFERKEFHKGFAETSITTIMFLIHKPLA